MNIETSYRLLVIRSCSLSRSRDVIYSVACLLLKVSGNNNINVNKIPQDIEAKSSPYASQPITVAGTTINKYTLALNDNLENFI